MATSNMNSETEDEDQKEDFKIDVLNSLVKILYVFLITFFIIVLFCRSGYLIDQKDSPHNILPWNISISIVNLLNVLTLILAIYNRYINNKDVVRLKNSKNYLIFYFLTIPTVLLAILYYTIGFVQILIASMRHFRITIFYFTVVFLISGIMIVVKDSDSTDWERNNLRARRQNLIHNFTVNVVILQSIFVFLYELFDMYINLYLGLINTYLNRNFTDKFAIKKETFKNIWWMVGSGSSAFQIISLICLLTSRSKININIARRFSGSTGYISRVQMPKAPIIVAVAIIVAGLVPMPILLTFKHNENIYDEKSFFIALLSVGGLVYLVGIFSCIFQFQEVKIWKTFSKENLTANLTDRSFLWVGLFGQLLSAFSYSYYLIDSIFNESFDWIYVMYLVFHVLETVQSVFQTVLIEFTMNKKWNLPMDTSSFAFRGCPILLLIAVNFTAFFICLYKNYTSQKLKLTTLSANLLFRYGACVGDVFTNIQRLHATLYFVQMFIVIYL